MKIFGNVLKKNSSEVLTATVTDALKGHFSCTQFDKLLKATVEQSSIDRFLVFITPFSEKKRSSTYILYIYFYFSTILNDAVLSSSVPLTETSRRLIYCKITLD